MEKREQSGFLLCSTDLLISYYFYEWEVKIRGAGLSSVWKGRVLCFSQLMTTENQLFVSDSQSSLLMNSLVRKNGFLFFPVSYPVSCSCYYLILSWPFLSLFPRGNNSETYMSSFLSLPIIVHFFSSSFFLMIMNY